VADQLVAMDAGTSMVKALRLDSRGEVLAQASDHAPPHGPTGTDPDALWDVAARVLRQVSPPAGTPLRGVVVTGQGDGLWRLDADGLPRQAHLWNSTRAASVVSGWVEGGEVERHFRRSGTVLWPGTSAALWRWLEAEDPAEAAATATVFCAKDLLNHRLCGVVATDVTDATIPFLDLDSGTYDPRAIAELGCGSLAGMLAPVLAAGEVIGRVHADAAAATGVPEGTTVYQGALDLAAMMRGLGLRQVGDALAVLGTTASSVAVSDVVPRGGEVAGQTVRLAEPDRFLRVMAASSGTGTLDWFLRTHGYEGADRYDRLWDELAGIAPEDEHVLLLPYLAGERAPFLAPEASGSFLGLTHQTSTAELGRATIEGITCSLRHGLDAVGAADDGQLVLTGGGAGRPDWCQLVADVVGRPVDVDERPHVGVFGVASFVPGFEHLATTAAASQRRRYEPGPDSSHRQHRYRGFLALLDAFRPIWKELMPT
jgi:erythritol kinase (D-erythritol 1-phosphate-forming)